MIDRLYTHKPCAQCPFRKDSPAGWLDRAIEGHLEADTFVCHKTAQGQRKDRRQCAGHMILRGEENTFVLLANSLQIPLDLRGQDLVFDNGQDCIRHHKLLTKYLSQ